MGQFSSVLSRLNKSRSIIALQDACISLVPMILAVTLLLMVAEGLALVSSTPVIDIIRSLYHNFYVCFPLLFTISLSISFAKSKEVDPTSMVIICVFILALTVAGKVNSIEELYGMIYFKLIPIPLCYFTATFLRYFTQKNYMQLFKSDFMSYHLNKTFNYIIPSVLTFTLVFGLFHVFEQGWELLSQKGLLSLIAVEDTENIGSVIMIKLLYQFTWFFGVNPSHVFSFLQAPYYDAYLVNNAAYLAGTDVPNLVVSGNHFFTDIGGSGSVLCLILAILLYSKSSRNRHVAKISAIPSTFNISEIIHYGLPIVFNPFLLVPFVLVPIVLFVITNTVMGLGWVDPVVVYVPWTTPPLLNVYLATGGDWSAVLLQLFNLSIGMLIYLKFLRMLERSHLDEVLVQDFVSKFNLESKKIQALQYRNQRSMMKNLATEHAVNAFLLKLSHGKLLLNYQPIIDAKTQKVAKVEALLRLRDKHGNIFLPDFINDLSEVGLSTEIDKWVVKRAVKQSHDWPSSFSDIEISINISPVSLLDRSFIDFLIEMHHKSKHPFCIEILENHAVFEEDIINKHLKLLKEQNVSVYLDDFGSGYSALALLPKLNIHGVKYDMEFTSHLESEAGAKVFDSCLSISQILKHKTVIEGIETEAQFKAACESGVDYMQGFYISEPLQHEALAEFIENQPIKHQS